MKYSHPVPQVIAVLIWLLGVGAMSYLEWLSTGLLPSLGGTTVAVVICSFISGVVWLFSRSGELAIVDLIKGDFNCKVRYGLFCFRYKALVSDIRFDVVPFQRVSGGATKAGGFAAILFCEDGPLFVLGLSESPGKLLDETASLCKMAKIDRGTHGAPLVLVR